MPNPNSDEWHSGYWDSNSHVLVVNNTGVPVVTFAFPFFDPAYISYAQKAELRSGSNVVFKAASNGAGKITVGIAIQVLRKAGGDPIDTALAVIDMDLCQLAMMGEPRFKLALKNVKDNTVCYINMNKNGGMFLSGKGVSGCACGSTTEIEGASNTGMAFARFAQMTAKAGVAVATGGGSAASAAALKAAAKATAKAVAKELAKKAGKEAGKRIVS